MVWLAVVALAAPGKAAVRVWEAPLAIPTYELGAPDPNPVFMAGPGEPGVRFIPIRCSIR